jgi:hypothetical protein
MSPTRFRPRPDERQDERHDRTCNRRPIDDGRGAGCRLLLLLLQLQQMMMMMVMMMLLCSAFEACQAAIHSAEDGILPAKHACRPPSQLRRDIPITDCFRAEWNQMRLFVHVT